MDADYVIIGAGSAGCALAARLSEDSSTRVLVIEHGGSDWGPFIQMPAALSYPMNMARYDWGYRTLPEPGLNNRSLVCPRGKVLGGSSSINGMIYVRGNPGDYNHWQESGAKGWGYEDVLPYFKRLETAAHGDPDWRGTNGPLTITRGAADSPLDKAFLEAGNDLGYPLPVDYNGEHQEGFTPFDRTTRKGKRHSAYRAYLRPALQQRDNLSLLKGLALKVTFDGRKATGLKVRTRTGEQMITTRKAVILAASAINSPKLLMLSGIGPGDKLQKLNIPVIAERKGVGRNLQDHLELYIQQECLQPVSLYRYMNIFQKARIGIQWLLFTSGPGATNHFESGAFLRSRPDVTYPDLQIHFLPVAIRYDGTSPAKGHGFQAHIGPMRALSRGHVELTSPDPDSAPSILFNYLTQEQDLTDFRAAIRLVRKIFAADAMKDFAGQEIAPGAAVTDDKGLDEFTRNNVESAYHPCGTCKIGASDDPDAVVDPECRVIGCENLYVADSSIFPRIPNGNLNAPSTMVGEKAADHIRQHFQR